MMKNDHGNPADVSKDPAGRSTGAKPEVGSGRVEFVSSPRMKIRCPNCQKDGSARAELVNRRVSCKHCSFVFRALPVDGDSAAPARPPAAPPTGPTSGSSRDRVEAFELEIRRLRDALASGQAEAGLVPGLRDQLAHALDAARRAEAREQSLREEVDGLRDRLDRAGPTTVDEGREGLREEELRFLRDQLDKARAEVESESRRRREAASALDARAAEHARALQGLREELEQVRGQARAEETSRAEAEDRRAVEARGLRDEIERARGELDEARKALDGLRLDRDQAAADHDRAVDELRGQVAQLEAGLGEADSVGAHRDRLAEELESTRSRLLDAERAALKQEDGAEGLRLDRDRLEAERAGLREELEKARVGLAEAEAIRRERDEARIQRDRFAEELDALQARLAEAERLAARWSCDSTELEVTPALASGPTESDLPALHEPGPPALFGGAGTLQAEFDGARSGADSLQAELSRATDLLARKDAELADLALERDRARAEAGEKSRLEAEAERLRRDLEKARAASEAAARANRELSERIRALESTPVPASAPVAVASTPVASTDPAAVEAERKRAVDEAVKGAWADFERRLAETQAKLKAANARADLMEIEAREAREQAAARERGQDLGDGSSFGEAASMTSIRILSDRGTARLTPADAEARLGLARQVAVDRKDKSLIDRIGKMAGKVRDDLEARNYTLAETLVRGAEIETGLDPGGFSISGLRIFRASPTIVGSLTALAPAFDRVMRQGDLGPIRSTLDEMRTILGDQAGLPEIRRVGRTPAVKRPIREADALRLFVAALEAENWLMRPIAAKKPLPDTSLTTYASLIEACSGARESAERLAPDRVPLLDGVIQASCLMLARRQQADGHFSFLDPRGKAGKLASVVEGMAAQRPDAVKDGWVIHVDPLGMAQAETGACGVALAAAGKALGRPDLTQAAQKAADWAMGQPCLPNFVANAASAGLLARAYLDARQDRHLVGLARKLSVGLLPGQVENGRWVDATSATTPNHLAILRALHDAWEAIPVDRDELRDDLKPAIDLAMNSLLAESKTLGVPSQGNALRDLLRHRDLFRPASDPRLEAAILDSATVIQELCHEGPKPKLGVAPDQLAALSRA